MISIQIFILSFRLVDDNHLAFYFRAQAYFALQRYDESLNDTTHVISLRPLWNKVLEDFLLLRIEYL